MEKKLIDHSYQNHQACQNPYFNHIITMYFYSIEILFLRVESHALIIKKNYDKSTLEPLDDQLDETPA